jgi:hypothetical protein
MARFAIDTPVREGVRGGLLSVAQVVDAPKEALYLGVKYLQGDDTPPVPVPDVGEDKDFAIFEDAVEAEPFTLYKGVEYAILLGEQTGVAATFAAGETYGVEKALQAGVLNTLATDLTPTPGTPVTNIKYAIGLLEQYAADNYVGLPLMHGNRTAVALASDFITDAGAFKLHTVQGTPIANGGGYGPDGPDSVTAGAGEAWLYISGGVTILRGPLDVYPAHNLKGNRTLALAERTYVPVVDSFVAAILVGI